jgi:DNA polymerase III delta subunit
MKNLILFFGEEKLLIKEEINKIRHKIVPDFLFLS